MWICDDKACTYISYQELFGAIGPIKRARLLKEGVAEVVYLNKEDVQKAIQKYNNRELDGKDVIGMARRHFFLQWPETYFINCQSFMAL